MADEKLNALADSDLEGATGGKSTATNYVHKDCGGHVYFFTKNMNDGSQFQQYRCDKCHRQWGYTSIADFPEFEVVE